MMPGERIAFWWEGSVHVGTVITVDHVSGALMAKCHTIEHDSVMLRDDDVIKEEEEDEGL